MIIDVKATLMIFYGGYRIHNYNVGYITIYTYYYLFRSALGYCQDDARILWSTSNEI